MKKITLSVFIVLACSFQQVSGQSSDFGWGVKAGINSSGVHTNNTFVLTNKPVLGWQLGVFSQSMMSGWGYLIEADFGSWGSEQTTVTDSQKSNIGYLTLPLAIQYRTGNAIGIYLGGYASFRMWAKRKSSIGGAADTTTNIKDNVAFIDYGLWVGFSYTLNRLIFDLRYLQGLANVNTNSTINAQVNNASGQLSIGYFLK